MALIDDILRFGANLITGGGPGQAIGQQGKQNYNKSKAKAAKAEADEVMETTGGATTGGLAGAGLGKKLGTPDKPITKTSLSQHDPLVNQVKFAESIQPFVSSMLQSAVGGMGGAISGVSDAANQYQSGMQGVMSDERIPEHIRAILGRNTGQLGEAAHGVAQGMARSGSATMPYQLLMSAIKAMQDQEQAYRQQEIEFQKQIALEQWKAQQVGQTGKTSQSAALVDKMLQGG